MISVRPNNRPQMLCLALQPRQKMPNSDFKNKFYTSETILILKKGFYLDQSYHSMKAYAP